MKSKFWKNKNVLITGTDGFIGSRLFKKLLNNKVNVFGTIHSHEKINKFIDLEIPENRLFVVELLNKNDLINLCRFKKIDTLIHCAAVNGNAEFKESNTEEVFKENVAIVDNVIQSIKENNIPSLMILSSAEVYSFCNSCEKKESDINPLTFNELDLEKNYKTAKIIIEKKSLLESERHGFNLFLPRINNAYGPGFNPKENQIIPKIIKNVLHDKIIEIWGDRGFRRNFIYIDDLTEALILMIENNSTGPLNIASSEKVEIRAIPEKVGLIMDKKVKVNFLVEKLAEDNVLNNDKLKLIINFEFKHFDEGLKETINYFNDNYFFNETSNLWQKKEDLLVTVADSNYLNAAKQLFVCAYLNAGWRGDYMLISHNLKDEERIDFKKKNILVFEPPLISEESCGGGTYPSLLLSKIYLFREDFKKWRHIVFLDADIIIRFSLKKLLQGNGFMAPNATSLKLKDEFSGGSEEFFEIKKKINLSGRAFTTGVFSFNTKIIKKDTFKEMLNIYNKYKKALWLGEESLLNIFFYKNWQLLSDTYNTNPDNMLYQKNIKPKEIKDVIIHFCRAGKPWNKDSFFYQEWVNNLLKFSEINFQNHVQETPMLGDRELNFYKVKIFVRHSLNIFNNIYYFIDRKIGLFGIFIKNNYPSLYQKIKRFKNVYK